MTALALGTELAFVHVFRRVTIDALTRDFLEARRQVALRTGGAGMGTEERERGRVVIEEDATAPAAFVVTLVATRPLATVMHVLAAVADIAGSLQVLLVGIALVAGDAADLAMTATQGVARPRSVVEGVTAPVVRCVTVLTRVPEAALVGVVTQMAAVARRRRTLRRDGGRMATFTGDGRVFSDQGEARPAPVIELGRRPALRRMAGLAGLAEAAAVFVVLRVTGGARPRSRFVPFRRVTPGTFGLAMLAYQREGGLVVEAHLLPRGLGVTAVANGSQ